MCRRRGVFLEIRFVLSGNLRFLWGSYLFNHLFRDVILKKGVFVFLSQFTYFNHQIKFLTYYTMHAMNFWIFFPNTRIWIQGSGAAGHVTSMAYFSNLFAR
jgi:hypothetical protein